LLSEISRRQIGRQLAGLTDRGLHRLMQVKASVALRSSRQRS
jgi:hypothetical protein